MLLSGFEIDHSSELPVYRQIADAVYVAADEGRLRPGHRLPATRDLARQLGVNRNTVVAAYERLAADGVVQSYTGRGTFVADRPAGAHGAGADSVSGSWSTSFSRAVDGPGVERLLTVYQSVLSTDGISFAGSYPPAELMPVERFRQSLAAVFRDRPESLLAYGPTAGDPALRDSLAAEMTRSGTAVSPENILITNGAQQALELIFRTLLDRGDCALVEDPTYTGAISVLGSIGARVIGLPADDHGIVPDTLESALQSHRPRLVYLQPTFQNPTTRVMPGFRRGEILEIARRHHCPVVEDDWAGDLRFDGADEPTLHALDGGGQVLYLSTFSKKLMPGLRIGWIAAPPEVMRRLVALKQIADCGTSPVLQGALRHFMQHGHLDAHLRAVRSAYRDRRDRMIASLERNFPAEAVWGRPDGGLFLWVRLPGGFDGDELFAAAKRRGVTFSRGALFHLDGRGAHTLRLTYASVRPERIDEGIAVLGELIRGRWPGAGGPQADRVVETVPVL